MYKHNAQSPEYTVVVKRERNEGSTYKGKEGGNVDPRQGQAVTGMALKGGKEELAGGGGDLFTNMLINISEHNTFLLSLGRSGGSAVGMIFVEGSKQSPQFVILGGSNELRKS